MASSVMSNHSLQELNIELNIYCQGGKAISEAIRVNKTLQILIPTYLMIEQQPSVTV